MALLLCRPLGASVQPGGLSQGGGRKLTWALSWESPPRLTPRFSLRSLGAVRRWTGPGCFAGRAHPQGVLSGQPHWEQGRTCFSRFERGAPSGGVPAGPTVPPQCRWVPPPKPGAWPIPPSLAGSSPRARFPREAAALKGTRGHRPSHGPGGPARAATFPGPDAGVPLLRPLFSRAAEEFNARAVRAGALGRSSQAGPSGAGPSCVRHDRSPGHAPLLCLHLS
ncbi:hypothetical protein NDU88_004967 [Pleurodeles waltl]|uniref:Uncharacterized protein n=1 Tax=Pleurodeles waltl TaxID=8319 RepID=A0AAV7MD71_PLEWA|nr:hypothetical protein NDU88_004967 [Pleurodeles waltl]